MGRHGGADDRKVNFRQTYPRLLRYARPYWRLVALILALSLVTAFLSVLPPQVMGVAVDEITGFGRLAGDHAPAQTTDERSGVVPDLRKSLPIVPYMQRAAAYMASTWLTESSPAVVSATVLVGAFLVLFVISRVFSAIQGIIMAKVGQGLIFDMRSQAYRHVQKLSLSYFEDQQTGDVMSRVVNDVNSLESVIVGPVIRLITDVCRLGFVLYFCMLWDWQLTSLSLTAAPLLLLSTYFVGKLLRRNFRELRRKVGELNALIQDNISGIRIIQSFVREEHELGRFNVKSRENYTLNVRLASIFATFRPWVDFLNQIGILVVLGVGSVKVMNGELNPGMFVVFLQSLPMLFGPITGLTRFYNHVQRALASCERVFELLDTDPAVESPPNAMQLPPLRGEVEFRHVDFEYRDGVQVLHDIHLHAKPGQMMALVGPSGAGKTTLVNLIPRFYDISAGGLLVDGEDVRQVDLDSLRSQIGIVLQDPFLFNATVKENLRYGRHGATDDDLIEAAKAANAHGFISDLVDGYDTLIGERGVKLSGGQRQRISIARAILADARILILDEATSSVDSETEMLIQQAIDNLVRNRTTFVIAHRLSTVQHADQIIVLEDGSIVETGSHEELLDKGGLYARLHDVQFRLNGDRAGPDEPEQEPRAGRRGSANDEYDIPDLTNGSVI
ncbi:ABC transporter ATP-binding protein [Candidatus Poribacteria bacterium]|nr:ABC transporter ATP-binding protein [Candidatus Poribacteria bacterium]